MSVRTPRGDWRRTQSPNDLTPGADVYQDPRLGGPYPNLKMQKSHLTAHRKASA